MKNKIIKYLTCFKNNINTYLKTNENEDIDIKITLQIIKSNYKQHKCHAKINNRQCSRKWRYVIDNNHLCGLHKSNNFSIINSINQKCLYKTFYINNLMRPILYHVIYNGEKYTYKI
jgi:hypothetical protein